MIRLLNFLEYRLLSTTKSRLRSTKIPLSSNVKLSAILINCKLGHHNYIGEKSILNSVNVGNYCSIAPHVIIGLSEHKISNPSTSTKLYPLELHKETIIDDDVWIGSGAVILQGVNIGRGAVIGAGAIVTRNVEPYCVIVGVPGKVIKKRFSNDQITLHQQINFKEKNLNALKLQIENLYK